MLRGAAASEVRGLNFYEHRIRDYDAATAHLSWDEDMAYSRLIRWYYRKERPIPADVAEACRQVRATSKPQRAAVEAVLNEFFVLQEDGWHKDDCDELIAEFQAREPERQAKKTNEDTRLKRHRDERARLFGAINAAGHHLPYNAPIADVRALAERIDGKPATPNATQPATAPATPATATQIPDPSSHSPLPTSQNPGGIGLSPAAPAAGPPPEPPGPPPPKPKPAPSPGKAPGAGAPSTTADRGHRLSKGWALPKAWGDWALGKYPHWDAETVRAIASKFRNYWVAKTGKDATKLDWKATWENWCDSGITQREHPAPRTPPETASVSARNAEAKRLLRIAATETTTQGVLDA